ncbi:hypothetical protein BCR33DRAFT_582682 [Rhizoclosmatium globosum]|uniref:Xylanolytic transcriptional activator regulatory domain-containing protein n=1 Tax=Rhizoclosmatium globosum TaxID=329046 RepID=A0A1Y2CRG1_9FUNG|nr:hypothetical protein BCR33DRAFT_582682 [Rhizoclosmatium globosum]|eukprot:ORY49424.1 hypothetical protein BCR33DRAFT_582682 [Rhizoclosmatium globosum]
MRNISSQSNIPESTAESLVPSEGRSGGLLSVNSQPLNPSLAQLVQSIEDPIPDDSILDSESLDSDLYPTEEEFNLVTRFLTNDRRALVILATMDGSKFLERYRDQPAALRYTVAAIAAHFMSPSTPEETILSYYRRARMAIFRVIDKPCLETFQALIWITWLSRWKGDPEMGRPFMNAAIQMGHWLRLDVDPDDSPSLKLNVFEAETRRRAFWSLHFLDVTEKTLVVDVDPVAFQPVRMKPLGTVSQIFMASEATQLSFQTYNLIAAIKRYYSVAPASLDELIVNQTAEQLTVRLAAVDAGIPSKYKLITAAAEVITSTDIDRFSQQLSFLHPKEYPIVVIGLNMNLFASICMLQRPRMFLLASNHSTLIQCQTRIEPL